MHERSGEANAAIPVRRRGKFRLSYALLLGLASSLTGNRADADTASADTETASERVYEIPLPIFLEDRSIGAVRTQLTESGLQAVHTEDLAEVLRDRVPDDTIATLRSTGEGFVAPETIERGTAIVLFYDNSNLVLSAQLPALLHIDQRVDFAARRGRFDTLKVEQPRNLALGVTGAVSLITPIGNDDDEETGYEAFIDGFANIGGVRGLNIDYAAVRRFTSDPEWERGRIVAFRDNPDTVLRVAAGDLFSQERNTVLAVPEYLGFQVSRDYSRLAPNRNVRPTGNREIFLERPSRVDVFVNGVLVSTIDAQAGELSLENIPFAGATNDVVIVVEDEFGRRELDTFGFAADQEMLAAGRSEWEVGGGFQRERQGTSFDYSDKWIAAASYRRGVGGQTLGASVQASEDGYAVAASTITEIAGGIVNAQLATSLVDDASGYAGFVEFVKDEPFFPNTQSFFDARIDYASEDFQLLDQPDLPNLTEYRIRANYRHALNELTTASAGIQYTNNYGDAPDFGQVSVGLSRQMGRFSLSLLADTAFGDVEEDQTRVFVSLTRRFGLRTVGRASYDTRVEEHTVEVRRPARNALGEYGFDLRQSGRPDVSRYQAVGRYTANRFDAESRIDYRDRSSNGSDGRVELRLQSGLAVAGGRAALGRDPGRGFYIMAPHQSLKDASLEIYRGARAEVFARSGALGPAAIPVERSYGQESIRYGVDGAPVGYDTGPGEFHAEPGARSGYLFTVGSDAFRSARGFLMLNGEPIPLVSGQLWLLADDGSINERAEPRTVFTNRDGRFFLSSLEAGSYEIRLNPPFDYRVRVKIPENETFIELGSLEVVR